MKWIFLAILFSSSMAIAKDSILKTNCKENDCFKNGWVTTGENYSLDTVCKQNDCTHFGWNSVANDNSSYHVKCKAGGCFVEGWTSLQVINSVILYDEVTCKDSSCLGSGWTVLTGYDFSGGNVTCVDGDCSRFGGFAEWRGKNSSTQCLSGKCYTEGWVLTISDPSPTRQSY